MAKPPINKRLNLPSPEEHKELLAKYAINQRMAEQDEKTAAFKKSVRDVGEFAYDALVPQTLSDVALEAAFAPAKWVKGGLKAAKRVDLDNLVDKYRQAAVGTAGVTYTPETEGAVLEKLLRAGADTMKSAALAQPASKQEFLKLAGKTHTDLARALERKAKDPRYSMLMRDLLEKYEVFDPQKAKEVYDSGHVFVGSRGVTFGDIDARSAKNTTPGIHFAPAGQERQVADILAYKQSIDAGKPDYDPKVGLVAARIKNPILVSDREAEFPAELATKLELVPEFREMVASGLPESEAITVLARRNGVGPLIYGNKIEGVKGRVNPSISIIDPDDIQKFSAGGLYRMAKKYRNPDQEAIRGTYIIKEPGGQWLGGNTSPESTIGAIPSSSPEIRKWLDTKLRTYVKNEMGTKNDPIRKLAEEGVTPTFLPRRGFANPALTAQNARQNLGFPALAKSELAKDWEDAVDASTRVIPAGTYLDFANARIDTYERMLAANPWLAKVPPETPVHSVGYGLTGDFSHMADELANITNPASGLPPKLMLDPEKIGKLSVEDVVRRVDAVNKWREANRIEADALRANNAATVLHKEYPENNPLGLRWVELKAPQVTADTLPEGYELRTLKNNQGGEYFSLRDMNDRGLEIGYGSTPEAAIKSAGDRLDSSKELQDALKYEGDTMGHCVGGYCDDVLSGRSRIYSLRDTKGQPHVTIEVAPRDVDSTGLNEAQLQMVRRHGKSVADEIIQIKGKANRAPNEEYLPFVQDFVRSQNWSNVGDLKNTGLVDLQQMGVPAEMRGGQRFVTEDEYKDIVRKNAEGFAAGGLVGSYAGGGIVKRAAKNLDDLVEKYVANEALPTPEEHSMLQGFYRGYAGENKPAKTAFGTETYFVSPQRKVGEYYAKRRAAEKGEAPHLEMIMADPFALRNSPYKLGIPLDKHNRDTLITNALRIDPNEIKNRIQLYADGGVVDSDETMQYNPTHIDSLANQLMEEVYGQ